MEGKDGREGRKDGRKVKKEGGEGRKIQRKEES